MKVSESGPESPGARSASTKVKAVLPAAPRSESGDREYGDDDPNRVRVLATLRSLGLDLHEAGRLASLCSDGRCDEMAADLIPQIEARRAEIATARAELDHLDAELVNLTRTLHTGEPRAVLELERWTDAAADRDQGSA